MRNMLHFLSQCLWRGHDWKFHDATITVTDVATKAKKTACRFWSQCRHCQAVKNDRAVDLTEMFGKREKAQ